jgi:hypothetical protein
MNTTLPAPAAFLTYSTAIPSRQTYLASVGLALLFGAAAARFGVLRGENALHWLLAAVLLHNCAMLWGRKRGQFLDRAEPTTRIIELARKTHGDIWVRCFPRAPIVADAAVELGAPDFEGKLIWGPVLDPGAEPKAVFCFADR